MHASRAGSVLGRQHTPLAQPSGPTASIRARASGHRRPVLCMAGPKPPIMVNSCSGRMGHATAEAVVDAGLTLVPLSFAGEREAGERGRVNVRGLGVELVPASEREGALQAVLKQYPGLVLVDYTLPAAVNGNARFYCAAGVPFVMGTTGGDRDALLADVRAAGTYAVIAPNMGKQIVAFQAMIQLLADSFPGSFKGYSLEVVESHQAAKADTSGTAKAVVASMRGLGLDFDEESIERVRDEAQQLGRMGVPPDAIAGHAFHTYTLTSPDGGTRFQFQHNVCGRRIYAEGTVDAALFLAQQVAAGSDKKLFDMIDVLRAGSMR